MIDAAQYKHTLSHFASGVTVVTVSNGKGGIEGFTASAFSALSLDPPLVLVCLDYDSECYEPLRLEKRFAVHILAEDQSELAWTFANRDLDKSRQADWQLNERGYPVLKQALAVIECKLFKEHEGGDHAIFIGEVEALSVADDPPKPLLYYQGRLGNTGLF